jgi:beta-glucosidase
MSLARGGPDVQEVSACAAAGGAGGAAVDIREIVSQLTLEEKASLCSGRNFWTTKGVARLGIEPYMLTDGPHGLRKQSSSGEVVELHDAVPATCFPTGAGLAATWNRALVEEVGAALGRESQAEAVGVILGPGVNIKRSPLCGRNFEYFSEDPLLAGELAKHHVRGIQAQGVGASVKHFAANNQETRRMTVDALVDERTLREIYLPAFEIAVREAQPWTVMCSYNKVNGTFVSENRWLLTEVLKEEWGHEGVVVSDWGAVDDRVASLAAGLELEMPGHGGSTDREIVEAVRAGRLDPAVLDAAVTRLLRLYVRVVEGRRAGATFDRAAHHALARRVAGESLVLLKNEGGVLPLPKTAKVAFLGAFARQPRYQGGGSSHVRPTRLDTAHEAAVQLLAGRGQVVYAQGYDLAGERPDPKLLDEARDAAAASDAAVVFIGLTDVLESEGFDRKHLRIPESHVALVEAVAQVQPRLVVVLSNGSPVEMPWLGKARAVLEGYLGGQAGGAAAVDALFGEVNPSGKLPETFPRRLEDCSAHVNFPGDEARVFYGEGLFVGYRHHDAADVEPLFPFGHGLSYTTFEYAGLALDKDRMDEGETLTVSLRVKNTGAVAGQEVVQLYVTDDRASVVRPPKELKGFEKVALAPGEEKTVRFTLGRRAFAFWDVEVHAWRVEAGTFTLRVGSSSRALRLSAKVQVDAPPPARTYGPNTTMGEVLEHPATATWAERLAHRYYETLGTYAPGTPEAVMTEAMLREMPMRNLVRLGRALTPEQLQRALDVLNGKAPPAELPAI